MTSTYQLPELPYDYSALKPAISPQLLELHHSKHHAAYVKGANEALDQLASAREADDYSEIGRLAKLLAFNVSGHVLHALFWNVHVARRAASRRAASCSRRSTPTSGRSTA